MNLARYNTEGQSVAEAKRHTLVTFRAVAQAPQNNEMQLTKRAAMTDAFRS